MRRFALFPLTLMLLVGGLVSAQDDTRDVDVTLYVDEDSLTVFLPETDRPVPLQDFGVFIQGRSAGGVYYLNSYPSLGSVDFTAVETPACFRLERFDTAIPLPMACQSSDVPVYVQALADGDVVWYDISVNEAFTLVLQRGGDVLNDATCPAGNPACTLTYSAVGALDAERFDDAEVGVVLATFERLSPDAPTVDRDLETQFIANRIDYMRVEDVVETEEQARELLDEFNATMVVYGEVEVDEEGTYRTRVRFEVEPRRSQIQTEIDEIASASATLDSFESYLLSGMDIFYVLDFIEGQMAYFEDEFDTALAFFQRAESNIPEGQGVSVRADTLYFYLGYTYQEGVHHPQLALENYTRAIELDDNDRAAYNNRGITLSDLGDYERAIADYNRALDLDPDYVPAYTNRGNAFSDLGDYEQAIVDYNRAIDLDPDFSLAYNNRGNASSGLGDYEQAIVDYNRAIDLDPDFSLAYNGRGNAFSDLGDYEQAIVDYNRAIDLDPDFSLAYNNRGNASSGLGDYERAIADYNRAIDLDPDFSLAYNGRGNAFSDLGDYEQAIVDYNRAIDLDPDFSLAYTNRGNAFSDLGDYEQAIVDYNRAIDLDPDFAFAYNGRGNAFSDLSDYEQAIADYTHAINLNPDYAAAYNGRGDAYRSIEQYEQAIADYTRTLELNPAHASAYNNRGLVYRDLEQYEMAVEDHSRALELDPTFVEAFHDRGVAYERLEQYEQAIADYERAIQLDPEYSRSYWGLGLGYDQLGQSSEALAAFQHYIELDGDNAPGWMFDRIAELEAELN